MVSVARWRLPEAVFQAGKSHFGSAGIADAGGGRLWASFGQVGYLLFQALRTLYRCAANETPGANP